MLDINLRARPSGHRRVAPPRPSREQQEGATADARAWPVAEAATTLRRYNGQRPRRADLPQPRGRDMAPDGPNQLWVADITYVAVATGFIYVAVILDAWSQIG